MRFGSVCSGIEAASVAWHELGWRAAWLAEIDKFASAVLAHHYPEVPNLGDMTKIARAILVGVVPAPDVLCGGTPCQAFSVAGLRNSLDDARGNLTLKFVEIADAIDHVRTGRGEDECVVVWENVPGVLSTKDNAFGCFLGGLAGEDGPLEPPGGKWANAGAVYGPRRAVAWRTMDAQYFGVAQRRRRVFVVASAREGFDPAQVLFEWDGLRRDTAPSRQAGQAASGSLTASAGKRGGIQDQSGGEGLVAGTLQANGKAAGSATQQDAESGLLVTHTPRGEGFDASEDGTGRGTPLVPVAVGTDCFNGLLTGDIAATMGTRGSSETASGPTVLVSALPFDTTQITSAANYSNPRPGDPCHPLSAGSHPPAVAFNWQGGGTQTSLGYDPDAGVTGSLSVGQTPAVAFDTYNQMVTGDTTQTLCSRGDSPGGNAHLVPAVRAGMQVRRLTPEECEALQGFTRGYTAIPWRGKPAEQCPDGPRYKALGNSWAVPNVTWIGRRIDAALRALP